MVEHLNKIDPEGVISQLMNKNITVNIRENTKGLDAEYIRTDYGYNYICINTKAGLEIRGGKDRGKVRSPALLLLHEATHAYNHRTNSYKFEMDSMPYIDRYSSVYHYDDAEEFNTIQYINKVAKKMVRVRE